MADLGKVSVTDEGDYSPGITYEKLTFVHYQGDAYFTLKTVKGITPTDDGVNYRLFCRSAELATASKAGIVKPAATDFTVDSNGLQKIKTAFTKATVLANIVTSEAWLTILGKISKAIEELMTLKTNALLNSMLTSIDVNDVNKVNTAAYIHTLVGRIGMGTVLQKGANLTDGINQLNSDMNGAKLRIGNTHISSNEDGTFQLVHNADMTNYIMLARFGGNTANYITFGGTIDANNAYGVVRDANGKGFAFSGSIFWISIGFSPAI